GNYRLSYQGEQSSTVFGLGYQDKEFGAQGFYAPAANRANETTVQRHAYLTHDLQFGNGQRVDDAVNYRQHDDTSFYLNLSTSEHQTSPLQTRLRYRPNQSLALGYEHNRESIESTCIAGNEHERDYSSVFAYGQRDFGAVQLAGSLSYLDYDSGDQYALPV